MRDPAVPAPTASSPDEWGSGQRTRQQSWSDSEVLVVDADERVRRGLDRLLTDAGLSVTAVADAGRARDQLTNRFFGVALVDLDTPAADAGLELVTFAKEKSPLTAIVVMTGRRTFETAAAAFRAGAVDAVPKSQDAVPYLRDRVVALAAAIKAAANRERLLDEVAEVHETFLTEMMELSRRVTDLEDRLLAREGDSQLSVIGSTLLNLLLVDDDSELQHALERHLTPDKGWRVRAAQTGGEALDAASQHPPQVLIVKEHLPDLPTSMIVKTVKSSSPDVVSVVFTPPARGRVGEVRLVEQSKLITIVPSFTEPGQLVSSLEEIRQGIKQKAKERRYLKVFRKEHFRFLQRWNQLKQRLGER